MITAILMRAIGTTVAKKLVLVVLKTLVKRIDNDLDDARVGIIAEVLDGNTSAIKKSKLK